MSRALSSLRAPSCYALATKPWRAALLQQHTLCRLQLLATPRISTLQLQEGRCVGSLVRTSTQSAELARALASVPVTSPAKSTVARVKKAKDPDRPKRPPTPWVSFLAHFRTQTSSQGSALKGAEVMKAAAAEWKAMSPSDKRRWEEPYEALKLKYDATFKEYVDSGKKDAWKRDPERPKRPLTGFMRYLDHVRPKYAHLKLTEQTKEIGAVWKALPPAEKTPYETAYKADKEKFDAALKAYKDSGKESAWEKKVGIAGERETKKAAADKLKAQKAAAAEKATKLKAKEKAAKLKAKEKAAKEKAKEKAAKEKEKEKAAKEKAKEKAATEKAKEKAAKEKEKEKQLKVKLREAKKKLASKSAKTPKRTLSSSSAMTKSKA